MRVFKIQSPFEPVLHSVIDQIKDSLFWRGKTHTPEQRTKAENDLSQKLLDEYNSSSDDFRRGVDASMVAMCGYPFLEIVDFYNSGVEMYESDPECPNIGAYLGYTGDLDINDT